MHMKQYLNRKTKEFTGKDIWWKVPQYVCNECGAKHTVLPDFIQPYKQYT